MNPFLIFFFLSLTSPKKSFFFTEISLFESLPFFFTGKKPTFPKIPIVGITWPLAKQMMMDDKGLVGVGVGIGDGEEDFKLCKPDALAELRVTLTDFLCPHKEQSPPCHIPRHRRSKSSAVISKPRMVPCHFSLLLVILFFQPSQSSMVGSGLLHAQSKIIPSYDHTCQFHRGFFLRSLSISTYHNNEEHFFPSPVSTLFSTYGLMTLFILQAAVLVTHVRFSIMIPCTHWKQTDQSRACPFVASATQLALRRKVASMWRHL